MRILATIEEALFSKSLASSEAIFLSDDVQFGLNVAVPIAAILLEYPVIYVPTSANQLTFLSGEPLHVYECLLNNEIHGTLPQDHSLLKFSAPCRVSTIPRLSPENIENKLKTLYETRLKDSGCNLTLTVQHDTKVFDRVAL